MSAAFFLSRVSRKQDSATEKRRCLGKKTFVHRIDTGKGVAWKIYLKMNVTSLSSIICVSIKKNCILTMFFHSNNLQIDIRFIVKFELNQIFCQFQVYYLVLKLIQYDTVKRSTSTF